MNDIMAAEMYKDDVGDCVRRSVKTKVSDLSSEEKREKNKKKNLFISW